MAKESFREYMRRLHCSQATFDELARTAWELRRELAKAKQIKMTPKRSAVEKAAMAFIAGVAGVCRAEKCRYFGHKAACEDGCGLRWSRLSLAVYAALQERPKAKTERA